MDIRNGSAEQLEFSWSENLPRSLWEGNMAPAARIGVHVRERSRATHTHDKLQSRRVPIPNARKS